MMTTPPFVIAHRGASAYAPENTRAAFRKAKELGAKWVEFDVRLTADGELIVFHDEDLARTTSGVGRVIDHPLDYLKSLDAGSWFAPSFHHEKILTLAEVISLLREENLSANIELKVEAGKEQSLVNAVLKLLHETGAVNRIPLVISSFNVVALLEMRRIHSSIPISYLMDEWSNDWKPLCDQLNCVSVNLSDKLVIEERLIEITKAGRPVMVYTINDPLRAKTLFSWGVAAVFSDCPDKILPVCALW